MVKVVWTQRALYDLENIGDYISNTGRIIPESNDKSIREIIKGSYRVIYQIRNYISILWAISQGTMFNLLFCPFKSRNFKSGKG